MSEPLYVTAGVVVPAGELRWRFSRSSGPGGQGVNTADSRAELSYDVLGSRALTDRQRERITTALAHRMTDGVLTVAASQFREQLRNRAAARSRLGMLLRDALAPPPPARRPTRPSGASKRRRVEAKRRRSQTKQLRTRPDD